MGTENPNRPNFPVRLPTMPFVAQQSTAPFLSSAPVVGSEASAFRAAPPASSQIQRPPFLGGPFVGSEPPSSRPPSSTRPNDLVRPPPPPSSSYGAPISGFPSNIASPMPPGSHPPAPLASFTGRTPGAPPTSVPLGHVSLLSQPQPHSVPMGSPPQGIKTSQSNPNLPLFADQQFSSARANTQPSSALLGPSYPTARGTFQPSFPAYPNAQPTSVGQAPPMQHSLQQAGYAPAAPPNSFPGQQRGHVPGPPTSLYTGNQLQKHGITPPLASTQGLAEDFQSLSLGSVPGSFDSGVDVSALPRPLYGDVEPKLFAEMYPMNCSPRVLRLTTSGIPNSQSLASRWHLPLGAVVCPLAEAPVGEEVPVVNFATTGIIRCRRCRTYVNPYITFTDNGRKWRCNICSLLNDVPGDYFAHVDASGRRVDLDQRPELTKGSVEFIAPAEYMVRPPMPPLYFFLIDVSISAVRSGMIEVMAQTIKSCLDSLPGSPRTQIGFITYDSTIHFYYMKSSLMLPQMMVVSDLDDIFAPFLDDLLVNLLESRSVVEAFLDSVPPCSKRT